MKYREYQKLAWIIGLFILAYFLPVGQARFDRAIHESLSLAKWYAREHVLLCLIPAFFMAGFISVFIRQGAVIKYLGGQAKKWVAYGMASVAGSVLAVCSCTILPLFAGIYKRGAGLGPAVAFLYAGPAINVLAVILTMNVLGVEIGIARIIGAVSFSIIIGLMMQFFYSKEEKERQLTNHVTPQNETSTPLWKTASHFLILAGILVFTNWGKPEQTDCTCYTIWANKGEITAIFAILFVLSLLFVIKLRPLHVFLAAAVTTIVAFIFSGQLFPPFIVAIVALSIILALNDGDPREWLSSTWTYAKQIFPPLAIGVLIAGFMLGSPGGDGIIPGEWVSRLLGGNALFANFFASIVGAFMYFATLTEIPILQGLMSNGMGKGPALALLLAGPALSLPNMLVIRSVIGTQKTIVFVALVVVMATLTGLIYGSLF